MRSIARHGVATHWLRLVVPAALASVAVAASLTSCTSTATTTAADSSSTKSTIPRVGLPRLHGHYPDHRYRRQRVHLDRRALRGRRRRRQGLRGVYQLQGGIHGRRIVVDSYDDTYAGAANKQYTQEAVEKDFATVGSFSLQDNFGGTVLAANPQVPNVTVSLTRRLSTSRTASVLPRLRTDGHSGP